MSILVFGSVNADLVFSVPRLPAPGETVLGKGFAQFPGGKGANQAVAAARDGAAVAFAGCVGRDGLAGAATAALREAGVDLARLAEVAAPTGCASICVDAEGRNQIAVAPGANALARAAQVEDAALTPATILLLQMEVPAAEIALLVQRAAARFTRCILNLAPPGDLPADLLRALHLLVLNEHEAVVLARRLGCTPDAAALRLAAGCDVAVTRGAAGAEAATAAGLATTPAFPVRPIDTTGAGDTWCGVLAAGLARGMPMADAMRRAAAAAALACTRPGAAAAMPWAAETDGLLATP
ncbi:PfkB family carbohydrate kinase [Falsiroseomonas selenitidurans]|uniref:Ribokinase n=1 Tax=Falsiroseomonas selenitidurans TaxID=2716335 RepID=A0ABX1EDU8_9PROT|nr:PfkB family carbohydrate kinase [Falsiroseomonas selenitidurans]NKC33070.1 ribokinase [Falsiroseomonas selenitidurans]